MPTKKRLRDQAAKDAVNCAVETNYTSSYAESDVTAQNAYASVLASAPSPDELFPPQNSSAEFHVQNVLPASKAKYTAFLAALQAINQQ
jgi:hypothetical protein